MLQIKYVDYFLTDWSEKLDLLCLYEISNTDENEWITIFTSNQNVLDVPIVAAEKNNEFVLEENFYKAFVKSVIDKANTCNIDSEKLVSLFKIMGKSWKKEFSTQMEMKLQELKFVVSPQIQKFCINSIKLEYVITEQKTGFSDLIKNYIEVRKEDVLGFVVSLLENSKMKYIPDEHYSEVLRSAVEKLQNSELKASLSKIFNITVGE